MDDSYDTIVQLLKDRAAAEGDRPFLHFEGNQISYRELDLLTNRVGNGLAALGVAKGDTVCLMLPNCLEFVYSWLGLAKVGAVEVPVNTAHKGDMLSYLINDSDAKVLIIDARYLDRIKLIEDELPHLETLVIWAEEPHAPVDFKRLRCISYNELYSSDAELEDINLTAKDEFCILYTSGTTGPSKGVVMPHRYVIHTCFSNAAQLGYTREEVLYTCLPLFHGNAQILAVLPALVVSGQVHLYRRFSAGRFWEEINNCGATVTNLPGSVISILLKQPPSAKDRAHTLKKVFTAGTPKAALEQFEERFGITIYEGYGSTECGMILMNTVEDRRPGSIGKPTDGYRVAVFDDDDNALPAGSKGELVTRPEKPFCMMKWYYKMPDKTMEACRNLWFHTGDYAYYDEDGYYYFVDRKKDVIRRRGENISSFEVERAVNSHPKVLESAALAIPDPLGEYEVKVVAVPRPETELGYEELIAFCQERMADFMVPRYLEFKSALPKTPTDRVEKYKLRQEGINAATWDRLATGK